MYVYVGRDVCRGWPGLSQIMHGYMRHVGGQAYYVEGFLQGVVGVDQLHQVCMEVMFARAD